MVYFESFEINNVTFYLEKNVSKYSQQVSNSKWHICKYNKEINDNCQYIILSSPHYHYTIGHFLFDAFIYLQYFTKIKTIIKEKYGIENIKVHYINKPSRNYKKLFFDLFDISENELIFTDSPETLLPENNICIYSDIITCHDQEKNLRESEKLKGVINDYKDFVNKKLINIKKKKNIDILFFTRTLKKENREVEPGNDRIIDYSNLLNYLDKMNRKVEIYTPSDETTCYLDQINLVKSCNYLIVEYGSGFFLNGLFAKNIIVMGNLEHHVTWNHYKNIFEVINNNHSKILFLQCSHTLFKSNLGLLNKNVNIIENELNKLNKFIVDITDKS